MQQRPSQQVCAVNAIYAMHQWRDYHFQQLSAIFGDKSHILEFHMPSNHFKSQIQACPKPRSVT
jgi:hypothetical protein